MPTFFKNWIRHYRHTQILRRIDLPLSGKVLDLSSSTGKFFEKLHKIYPSLNLFGIDIAEEDIEKAKINIPFASFKVANAEKTDFPDQSFDVVFSIMSLHHYQDPVKVFKEVGRILNKSGVFYLVDLIPKYEWSERVWSQKGCSEPYHFGKFYRLADLKAILEPLDFKVISSAGVTIIPRIAALRISKTDNVI